MTAKKLKATWTVDLERGLNVEDEIAKSLSESIAKEIDFEVMSGMLLEMGWTKVVLKPMTWEHGYEVDSWVETNIKGNLHTMGLVWLFERAEDANWFSLRWLG